MCGRSRDLNPVAITSLVQSGGRLLLMPADFEPFDDAMVVSAMTVNDWWFNYFFGDSGAEGWGGGGE